MSPSRSLDADPYSGYLYSYPHKTAYRHLDPPVPLGDAWADENTNALFLYLHVPFCERRCGYCNLFTVARPNRKLVAAWEAALARQIETFRTAVDGARFARFALGGGTPTLLGVESLRRALDLVDDLAGSLRSLPFSVETSPETATPETLELLAERGVNRISLGVQSMVEAEVAAVNRVQRTDQVEAAVARIRAAAAPEAILNIDLIYGLPRQTRASWSESLDRTLAWKPEEIYLYPLYSRPLTQVGRSEVAAATDDRLDLYRHGRARLLEAGYRQYSMRLFLAPWRAENAGPPYRCQEDGMVGLGVGARSYTRRLHYSSRYAADPSEAEAIIEDWNATEDHGLITHGIRLDRHEQRRRWVILSLLCAEGVSESAYLDRFAGRPIDDFPEIAQLVEERLATREGDSIRLTDLGFERSDALGPLLVSGPVRRLMEGAAMR